MRRRTAPGSRRRSAPATVASPRGRAQEGGEHAEGGRLAGAVGAEEADDLAGLDVEVHAAHGVDVSSSGLVGAGQAAGMDHAGSPSGGDPSIQDGLLLVNLDYYVSSSAMRDRRRPGPTPAGARDLDLLGRRRPQRRLALERVRAGRAAGRGSRAPTRARPRRPRADQPRRPRVAVSGVSLRLEDLLDLRRERRRGTSSRSPTRVSIGLDDLVAGERERHVHGGEEERRVVDGEQAGADAARGTRPRPRR